LRRAVKTALGAYLTVIWRLNNGLQIAIIGGELLEKKRNMLVIKSELRKVLFENIIVPLLSTIVFAILVFTTIYIIGSNNDWVKHSDQVLITVEDVEKNFLLAQGKRRDYFLGIEGAKEAYFSQYERVQEKIKNLEKLVSDNPAQFSQLKIVESELKIWNEAILPIFEKATTNPEIALQQFKTSMKRLAAEPFRDSLNELRKVEQGLRENRNKSAENTVWIIMIFLLPALIIVTGITVFRGRKSILKISDLYEKQNVQITKQIDDVSRQNWLQNHEAELVKKASAQLSINDLSQEVLKYCAEHFSVVAGCFYVREDDDAQVFVLTGSIGVDLSKKDESDLHRFVEEEAFHGLSIKTRDIQVLDASKLSQNWTIRSSLLDLTPQKIVSVPLVFANKVYAVIELAFTADLEPNVFTFLKYNLEGIASHTRNQLLLKQMRFLLSQVREKSLELEQQQEELRASNEELEERAQLLRDSQQEIETRNHELEENNILLEEQAENLERQNKMLEESRKILDQSAKDLESANQYKSQFLANMSHELRTPLNSALILSQLLAENKDKNLTPKQIEYAKQINRSGNDLLALINDILDLSKVEAGQLNFEVSQFTTGDLMESLQANFSIFAENKGLDLVVSDSAKVSLQHDRLRLMQVLNNLTSNAIKFTEKGKVTVKIDKKDKDNLIFTVADTGIGIEKNKLNMIFDPFKQADASITRRYGGTGLGLAITKRIVEAVGGAIQVESVLAEGTQFTVLLPLEFSVTEKYQEKPPEKSKVQSDESKNDFANEHAQQGYQFAPDFKDDRDLDLSVGKVLIVEDDHDFSKLLFENVKDEGFHCLVAHSADEAIKLIKEHSIHALLLDVHLPDHSGLFVLENIRKHEATKKIPVFIISAFDNVVLRNGEGVKFTKKPLSKSDLDKIVREIQDFSDVVKGKILIVEDNEHQAAFLKDHLLQFSPLVEIASNGQQAYDLLTKPHDIECVVLDYKLPDYNGKELLQKIYTTNGAPDLPIVITHTAMNLSREDEFDLKKYCKSIIVKGEKSLARITSDISTFLKTAKHKQQTGRNASNGLHDKNQQPIKGVQVLLVDDDVRNIYSLTAFLEEAGAGVTMASNGRDAIEVLKARSEFDLVLMDVMMPMMDGYETIKVIRETLDLKMLPIIALTAKAMQEDRKKCIEAGANDYLTKPVDLHKLVTMIKMWSNRIS
jgi:signal transduction histidine kinase/CheY-like chemotaxis protein/CHASE3 domain sensor protein